MGAFVGVYALPLCADAFLFFIQAWEELLKARAPKSSFLQAATMATVAHPWSKVPQAVCPAKVKIYLSLYSMSKVLKASFTTLNSNWLSMSFLKLQDQNTLSTHSKLRLKATILASPEFSATT